MKRREFLQMMAATPLFATVPASFLRDIEDKYGPDEEISPADFPCSLNGLQVISIQGPEITVDELAMTEEAFLENLVSGIPEPSKLEVEFYYENEPFKKLRDMCYEHEQGDFVLTWANECRAEFRADVFSVALHDLAEEFPTGHAVLMISGLVNFTEMHGEQS